MISIQQIKLIAPRAKDSLLNSHFEKFVEGMKHYSITTLPRIQQYIAQVAHECDEFTTLEEYASGKAYDTGRLAENLGNTPEEDGDGQLYKGRGFIQLTGKANYARASKALGWDFVSKPKELLLPGPAGFASAWFWADKGLNTIADLNSYEGFLKITKRINGGTNGLKHRLELWEKAKEVIL